MHMTLVHMQHSCMLPAEADMTYVLGHHQRWPFRKVTSAVL